MFTEGLPSGSVVKNPPANGGDMDSVPGLERSPRERNGNLPPVLLPGNCCQGQRSLAGYSPWGQKKSQTQLSD